MTLPRTGQSTQRSTDCRLCLSPDCHECARPWWQPASPGLRGWWEHYRTAILLAALYLAAAWVEGSR